MLESSEEKNGEGSEQSPQLLKGSGSVSLKNDVQTNTYARMARERSSLYLALRSPSGEEQGASITNQHYLRINFVGGAAVAYHANNKD